LRLRTVRFFFLNYLAIIELVELGVMHTLIARHRI
jgi:hypothetical protein